MEHFEKRRNYLERFHFEKMKNYLITTLTQVSFFYLFTLFTEIVNKVTYSSPQTKQVLNKLDSDDNFLPSLTCFESFIRESALSQFC